MSIKTKIRRILSFVLNLIPKDVVKAEVVTLAPSNLLQNRTALITGGTSGIGFAIAKAFLQSGANVIITGRSEQRLQESVKTLKNFANGHQVLYAQMDNTNVGTLEEGVNQILTNLQQANIDHIDILVNNAGISLPDTSFPNAQEIPWDNVIDTNLKGTFFLSQLFGKYLVQNKIAGNILNVASSSSLRPANSAYIVSKWGIRGLTLGLAKSLISHNIVVNGIAPGPTATPMLLNEGTTNIANPCNPSGRYALPEEIANMAVVLVSGLGKMIVGDIIYITGGAGVITYDDVNGYNNFDSLNN